VQLIKEWIVFIAHAISSRKKNCCSCTNSPKILQRTDIVMIFAILHSEYLIWWRWSHNWCARPIPLHYRIYMYTLLLDMHYSVGMSRLLFEDPWKLMPTLIDQCMGLKLMSCPISLYLICMNFMHIASIMWLSHDLFFECSSWKWFIPDILQENSRRLVWTQLAKLYALIISPPPSDYHKFTTTWFSCQSPVGMQLLCQHNSRN